MIYNRPNDRLQSRFFVVTPTSLRVALVRVALSFLALPAGAVAVVLWLAWRVLLSGCQVGSFATQLILNGLPTDEPAWRFQGIRSRIACEAMRLPHWNAPLRRCLLRLAGVRIGKGVFIGHGGIMDDYHPERIVIEDGAIIAYGVIWAAHGDRETMNEDDQTIIIRRGAYIGAGAILCPGCEVGEGAIIGAGAVVKGKIAAGVTAVGVPARPTSTGSATK